MLSGLPSESFACSLQTKGVPIEEVSNVVRSHWLWRRVAYKGGVIPPTNIQVVDGVPMEMGKHELLDQI